MLPLGREPSISNKCPGTLWSHSDAVNGIASCINFVFISTLNLWIVINFHCSLIFSMSCSVEAFHCQLYSLEPMGQHWASTSGLASAQWWTASCCQHWPNARPLGLFTKLFPLCDCRPQKIVWHGSNPRGLRQDQAFCGAWSTDKTESLGMASDLNSSRLLAMKEYSCSNAFVLLCVENTSRLDAKWGGSIHSTAVHRHTHRGCV